MVAVEMASGPPTCTVHAYFVLKEVEQKVGITQADTIETLACLLFGIHKYSYLQNAPAYVLQ